MQKRGKLQYWSSLIFVVLNYVTHNHIFSHYENCSQIIPDKYILIWFVPKTVATNKQVFRHTEY
jgi:hypothetical protein